MKIALVDCLGGASGNMLLGALIDAGLEPQQLQEGLRGLTVEPWTLVVERVKRRGMAGTHVEVRTSEASAHRHLRHVMELVDGASLPEAVRTRAGEVFRRLAEAEAHVHGTSPEKVHFHEVGAVDALVDIVGTLLGLHLLGVESLHLQTPMPAGRGFITCAHGMLPNPPPATVELCKGHEVRLVDVEAELVTPTGAALLTTLAAPKPFQGSLHLEQTGYGAGTWDLPFPNLLRLVIGTAEEGAPGLPQERVVQIDTNLDDMNPQVFRHVSDLLFEAGALDVWLTPIQMKKGRPAVMLSALARPGDEHRLSRVILAETTTLGVRLQEFNRLCVSREMAIVQTPWGPIPCKRVLAEGLPPRIQPEYEDCRRLARENQVPLITVLDTARAIAQGGA